MKPKRLGRRKSEIETRSKEFWETMTCFFNANDVLKHPDYRNKRWIALSKGLSLKLPPKIVRSRSDPNLWGIWGQISNISKPRQIIYQNEALGTVIMKKWFPGSPEVTWPQIRGIWGHLRSNFKYPPSWGHPDFSLFLAEVSGFSPFERAIQRLFR